MVKKREEKAPQADKESILKWLMQEYGNDVIRVAFSYVKNKQLAEDVAQEVFIKAYQNIDTFRHESSYKTWLLRITVNRSKDVLKSWAFRNIQITDVFSTNAVQDSIEQQVFQNEEYAYLSVQILKLPVKLREVIILHYYQDFSVEEISDLLNVNLNTIKTRLHRARQKLKKHLQEEVNYNER